MPLFIVSRTHDPNAIVEDEEWAMVHFVSTAWSEPRYDWVRSFGRPSFGFCVYRGPDARELGIQQRLCGLDFDQIREVEEVCGASSGAGIDYPPDGWSLFLAERTFPEGSPASLLEANGPHAEGAAGVFWLRSYWDHEHHSSRCILAAETGDAVREAVTLPSLGVDRLTKVATHHPSMWAHIYDRLGLPRHWETPDQP